LTCATCKQADIADEHEQAAGQTDERRDGRCSKWSNAVYAMLLICWCSVNSLDCCCCCCRP